MINPLRHIVRHGEFGFEKELVLETDAVLLQYRNRRFVGFLGIVPLVFFEVLAPLLGLVLALLLNHLPLRHQVVEFVDEAIKPRLRLF